MELSNSSSVVSKVVGVVYTDIVVYILPGLLLIFGTIVILGYSDRGIEWLNSAEATIAFLAAALVTATSFTVGLLISIIRWYLYEWIESRLNIVSFSGLVYNYLPRRFRTHIHLPESVLRAARRRMHKDMVSLGWTGGGWDFDPEYSIDISESSGEEKEKEKEQESRSKHIDAVDAFGDALLQGLRESGSLFFAYYDRWLDLEASRKSLIVTFQILFGIGAVKTAFQLSWIALPIGLLIIILLGLFYILYVPQQRCSHLRWVLLSYLEGGICVVKNGVYAPAINGMSVENGEL